MGHQVPNSKATYATGWSRFVRFCEEHKLSSLPAAASSAALFAISLNEEGLSGHTISNYLAAVAFHHAVANLPDPTSDKRVKLIKRRTVELSGPSHGRSAFSEKDLTSAAQALSKKGDWASIRDGALLFLAVLALLRSSELVALRWRDLAFTSEGSTPCLSITVRRSKTDQAGVGATIRVMWSMGEWCAASWLLQWKDTLKAHNVVTDWVFPCMGKDDKLGKPISSATVNHRFKAIAGLIGVDPSSIGSHSGRKTGATLLVNAGTSVPQLKAHGRWKSDAVFRYFVPDPAQQITVTETLLNRDLARMAADTTISAANVPK